MMLVAVKPANCINIQSSDHTSGSVLVSTMHVFSFSPSNVSAIDRLYFRAQCQTSGATFSYLVGTADAIHDYMNGILADVTGKLNVTSCFVSLTREKEMENTCIYILNDDQTHGTINITYTADNETSNYIYILSITDIIQPLLYYAGIFGGGALITLWVASKVFERRRMKSGEVHG